MLKQRKTTKLPTGYALKKRLLNLEYTTKIVGKASTIGNASTGDYRIIVLRTSKLTGVDGSIQNNKSVGIAESEPRVIVKRIKKTVFNTVVPKASIAGVKKMDRNNSESAVSTKLPVTYVYTVNPPATTLKEQYEHLALLAPYLPVKTVFSTKPSTGATTGFIGCFIASPAQAQEGQVTGRDEVKKANSRLVFYYPSQLKTWLGHLVDPSNPEKINPLNGLAELFQVLDQPVLTLLTQVNSPLTTISLLSNLATLDNKPNTTSASNKE